MKFLVISVPIACPNCNEASCHKSQTKCRLSDYPSPPVDCIRAVMSVCRLLWKQNCHKWGSWCI